MPLCSVTPSTTPQCAVTSCSSSPGSRSAKGPYLRRRWSAQKGMWTACSPPSTPAQVCLFPSRLLCFFPAMVLAVAVEPVCGSQPLTQLRHPSLSEKVERRELVRVCHCVGKIWSRIREEKDKKERRNVELEGRT